MILTLKTRHPGALGAGESSWGVGNSLVPLWGRPPPPAPSTSGGLWCAIRNSRWRRDPPFAASPAQLRAPPGRQRSHLPVARRQHSAVNTTAASSFQG